MAPHASTLAWKIPCTEEPGGLQYMGSHKGSDTTERLHFHFSLSCIGVGNGNPLQCSRLENPKDGGAWWAAVYGVAQSRTRLKWLSSSSSRKDIRPINPHTHTLLGSEMGYSFTWGHHFITTNAWHSHPPFHPHLSVHLFLSQLVPLYCLYLIFLLLFSLISACIWAITSKTLNFNLPLQISEEYVHTFWKKKLNCISYSLDCNG